MLDAAAMGMYHSGPNPACALAASLNGGCMRKAIHRGGLCCCGHIAHAFSRARAKLNTSCATPLTVRSHHTHCTHARTDSVVVVRAQI